MKRLAEAWLVLVLAVAFGSGLAMVHAQLQPRIERNKADDTERQIPAMVPGAIRSEAVVVGGQKVYRALDAASVPVGWVLPARGQGFADRIELLIGLDPQVSLITGLYVLEQKETPGLGDNITQSWFRERFRGRPVGQPLRAVKRAPANDQEIQAITGATISSESVVGIINTAIQSFRRALAEQGVR